MLNMQIVNVPLVLVADASMLLLLYFNFCISYNLAYQRYLTKRHAQRKYRNGTFQEKKAQEAPLFEDFIFPPGHIYMKKTKKEEKDLSLKLRETTFH